MKITDLAAWWGAIIATLVLLWDMYKCKILRPDASTRHRRLKK